METFVWKREIPYRGYIASRRAMDLLLCRHQSLPGYLDALMVMCVLSSQVRIMNDIADAAFRYFGRRWRS